MAKIELAGAELDALITYATDPEDGRALIDKVEVVKVKHAWDFRNESPSKRRVVRDVTDLLDDWQITMFEQEIDEARHAEAA